MCLRHDRLRRQTALLREQQADLDLDDNGVNVDCTWKSSLVLLLPIEGRRYIASGTEGLELVVVRLELGVKALCPMCQPPDRGFWAAVPV